MPSLSFFILPSLTLGRARALFLSLCACVWLLARHRLGRACRFCPCLPHHRSQSKGRGQSRERASALGTASRRAAPALAALHACTRRSRLPQPGWPWCCLLAASKQPLRARARCVGSTYGAPGCWLAADLSATSCQPRSSLQLRGFCARPYRLPFSAGRGRDHTGRHQPHRRRPHAHDEPRCNDGASTATTTTTSALLQVPSTCRGRHAACSHGNVTDVSGRSQLCGASNHLLLSCR